MGYLAFKVDFFSGYKSNIFDIEKLEAWKEQKIYQ